MLFSPANPDILSKWIKNGEPSRATAALEAIPEERRTQTQQILYCFAIALKAEWPTPSRMEEVRQGISMVRALQKNLNRKVSSEAYMAGQCDYLLGFLHFLLGEYKDAIPYFKKAPELGVTFTNQEMIEKCSTVLNRPKDRVSFRARTKKAWSAFVPEEADLRKRINLAVSDQKARGKMAKKVTALLRIAIPTVGWSWWEGDIPRIALQTGHSKCYALAEQYFLAAAPKALEGRWLFEVGTRIPDGEDLEAMEEDEDPSYHMDVQMVQDDSGMLRLNLYHPSLQIDRYCSEDANKAYEALNACIGDLVYVSLVRSVSFSSTPLQGDTVKLTQLLPTLCAMGYVDREDIPSLLLTRHPYTHPPYNHRPKEERRWRDDILRGSTMDLRPGELYEEGIIEYGPAIMLAGSGAVPCFVVFPLKGQTDNPAALMQTLLNELDGTMAPETALVLGNAEGLQFGYLDLLAWDLQPALGTVRDLLRKHNLPWACWHSFFPTDLTVQLF